MVPVYEPPKKSLRDFLSEKAPQLLYALKKRPEHLVASKPDTAKTITGKSHFVRTVPEKQQLDSGSQQLSPLKPGSQVQLPLSYVFVLPLSAAKLHDNCTSAACLQSHYDWTT